MLGTVCVYAQPPRNGMSQGDTGRLASSSSSSWKRSRWSSGAGAQHPAAWRFLVPELKDESEASEDDQTDNVSNEALYVIGLRGSGVKVSRYLQERAVAKVALSCHMALDLLRQELYEVERRRG